MKGFAWSSNRSLQRADAVSQRPVGGLAKRGFDIGGALLALGFLGPLLLLIACLIAFADGGPVFQSHQRIGRGGCVFNCLRFRTTLDGAGGTATVPFRPASQAGAKDKPALEQQPQVTPAGAVLTRLGLDGLPQLVNVLRGDMSFVGPRALAPTEIDKLGSAADSYLKSRPGLTGPWLLDAIGGASRAHRPAFARQYAENWSLLRDLSIIARSLSVAWLSRGD